MASKKRILFIHPDLGIGGAERLVIDAAVGLQERGHFVTVYTSHCDPKHCFDEARNGILKVRVAGNSIIPRHIFGRFSILCAILRQLHLTSQILLSGEISNYDCLFIDQLSACIPLFQLFAPQITVLFYCHFPDYLLTTRESLFKSIYRIPFDWIEGFTTGQADAIVVNSYFTQSVFASTFPNITQEPHVVYPCVDISATKSFPYIVDDAHDLLVNDGKKFLLSINRFERKKNIQLAIMAFACLTGQERHLVRLIIAGGYDNRVGENISYHKELTILCDELGLTHFTCKNFISSLSIPKGIDVLFLLSIPTNWKDYLLKSSSLLLYTPEREHFGIVPVEALLAELPVLANNSGGPLETIQDGLTGWLRESDPLQWTSVIRKALFVISPSEIKAMGKRGREKVLCEFSKEKMAERLEYELATASKYNGFGMTGVLMVIGGIASLGLGLGYMILKT